MSTATTDAVIYPDSDGEPIADSTLQFDWIGLVKWNAEALFRDRADVFVAGDNLIYPVEGDPTTRVAPDVYVAFGRPKGDRGSYKVWEEGGVFPQVIFEVWSPGNRPAEMDAKRGLYERSGAEEYYVLYPEFPAFAEGWRRTPAGTFERLAAMDGHVSPRLGVRFRVATGEMTLFGPDGREWPMPDETARERDIAEWGQAEARRERDEAERRGAEAERLRQESERGRAEAERRAEALAAKLRALGVDPDAA